MSIPQNEGEPHIAQPMLGKLVTAQRYSEIERERSWYVNLAISSREKADEKGQNTNPFNKGLYVWHKRRSASHERKAGELKDKIEGEVEQMFWSADRDEMSTFYQSVAANAAGMGNIELADELVRMSERSPQQALAEYKPGVHSARAQAIEQMAYYIGNRFKDPTIVVISDGGYITEGDLNGPMTPERKAGRNAWYSENSPENIMNKTKEMYELLGLKDFIKGIPDFTKEASFWSISNSWEKQHRTYISGEFRDIVAFSFIFIRPMTKSTPDEFQERYIPPRFGIQLNKFNVDWPKIEPDSATTVRELSQYSPLKPKLLPMPEPA